MQEISTQPKNKKLILLWIMAFIFTIFTAIIQRYTGPTYPKKISTKWLNCQISSKLLRSYNSGTDAPVQIQASDTAIHATLFYKRLNSYDDWFEVKFNRDGEFLHATIPTQPPAGKVIYKIELSTPPEKILLTDEPVVIRFKGAVPAYILIPHIIFMFLAMFLSNYLLFESLIIKSISKKILLQTFIMLILGGLILGPIVQKFAFGVYWSGFPFGHDLTDNKTLIAFIFWLIAIIQWKRNKPIRNWVLTASIVMLLIYLVPHSLFGSELDYTKL